MKNKVNIFIVMILCLGSGLVMAQEKKNLNIFNVLTKIIPNQKLEYWALIHNEYGRNKEIHSSGAKKEYDNQSKGFNLVTDENSFYFIAYSKGGVTHYITETSELKEFIGKIDNAQEAAISAYLDGYLIDEQFADLAANYYEDKSNYYLELGKVVSKECPYQKNYFTLTVSRSSGLVTNTKENGTYIELYTKKCPNNPRLQKIEKKEDPQEDPKKQPAKKK